MQDDHDGRSLGCRSKARNAGTELARSVSCRGEAHGRDGGGTYGWVWFGRRGLVFLVSEPGWERWSVDWAPGGGDAHGDPRRGPRGRGNAAGGLSLRPRGNSLRYRHCFSGGGTPVGAEVVASRKFD